MLQDIKSIGKKWDSKEVSDGYARNFLLPKKLAEMATPDAIKKAGANKARQKELEQTDLEKTQQLANLLAGKEILFRVKEKEGKMFGSITAKKIANELKKEKIELLEKNIILENSIKETGEYQIKIELEHGIETSIRVIVESA